MTSRQIKQRQVQRCIQSRLFKAFRLWSKKEDEILNSLNERIERCLIIIKEGLQRNKDAIPNTKIQSGVL